MVLLISFIVNVAQAIIIMLLIKDYKKLEEMDELKNENSNFMVKK